MPTYEYKCEKCGRRTTKMFPYRELERRKKVTYMCPHCGARMVWVFPNPAGRVK